MKAAYTAVVLVLCFFGLASAEESAQSKILKALEGTKKAYLEKNYQQMWQHIDFITQWLEENAPRSGLRWDDALELIREWVKKHWHEDVTEVNRLSEGGIEETTEKHLGSFYDWVWETGEKTVTQDFVFMARVKTNKPSGKKGDYKVRFHFDKGPAGWYIKSAGVM